MKIRIIYKETESKCANQNDSLCQRGPKISYPIKKVHRIRRSGKIFYRKQYFQNKRKEKFSREMERSRKPTEKRKKKANTQNTTYMKM